MNAVLSLSQQPQMKIGHFWEEEGGYYAGMMAYPDKSVYALIVAPKHKGSVLLPLTTRNHINERSPESTVHDGMYNTYLHNEQDFPALQWTANLRLNRHNDWYVFSKEELEIAMMCNQLLPIEEQFVHNREYWSSSWMDQSNAYTQMLYEKGEYTYHGRNVSGYYEYTLEKITGVYFDFGILDVRAGRRVRLF